MNKITGDEPIHHITGANGVPFNKSEIDKDLVFNNIFSGLTIRQHFAAMAMQGILAANPKDTWGNAEMPVPNEVANHAVNFADALIKALNK